MRLWRIATETRKYTAVDLSGTGASIEPGRWNEPGEFVVYCAPTIAMAVIETAAHMVGVGFPQNRFIVGIEVPAHVWAARETLHVERLPAAWSAIPAGQTSVSIGSAWLSAASAPILVLPSAIVPEETIALINPKHALAARIKAVAVRSFDYSKVFGRGL